MLINWYILICYRIVNFFLFFSTLTVIFLIYTNDIFLSVFINKISNGKISIDKYYCNILKKNCQFFFLHSEVIGTKQICSGISHEDILARTIQEVPKWEIGGGVVPL